jgi:hypothetical protein
VQKCFSFSEFAMFAEACGVGHADKLILDERVVKREWLRHHGFECSRIGPVGDDQILAVDEPVRSRRKS